MIITEIERMVNTTARHGNRGDSKIHITLDHQNQGGVNHIVSLELNKKRIWFILVVTRRCQPTVQALMRRSQGAMLASQC